MATTRAMQATKVKNNNNNNNITRNFHRLLLTAHCLLPLPLPLPPPLLLQFYQRYTSFRNSVGKILLHVRTISGYRVASKRNSPLIYLFIYSLHLFTICVLTNVRLFFRLIRRLARASHIHTLCAGPHQIPLFIHCAIFFG